MKTGTKLFFLSAAVLALLLIFAAVPRVSADLQQQSLDAIADAVQKSAAQCYAVEGVYPETLQYLEDHYGLVVNHKRYIVTYDAFSSNLPPEITVLVRGRDTP